MTHVARGVDSDGTLTVDVVMRGEVPQLSDHLQVTVLPYNEQYIQTGPGLSLSVSVLFAVSLYLSVCVGMKFPTKCVKITTTPE